MLRIRVSYDDKTERDEALRLVKYLVKVLDTKYDVYTSGKVYKNRKNTGGRIYMNVTPKKHASSRL